MPTRWGAGTGRVRRRRTGDRRRLPPPAMTATVGRDGAHSPLERTPILDLRADFIRAASNPASDRRESARRAGKVLALYELRDQLDSQHLRTMITLFDDVPGTAAQLWDACAAALAIPLR